MGTDEIDAAWVEKLMDWQKDEKKLHKKYTVMLINKAQEIFMNHDSLVAVHIDDLEEITVCGDIHGQYYFGVTLAMLLAVDSASVDVESLTDLTSLNAS